MGDTAAMLAEFHAALGQPYGHGDIADIANSRLRMDLHLEETDELIGALSDRDLVGTAQELADVVYVAYGTAHSLGIPLDAVLAAVHEANMTKFDEDGRPILRSDGKLLKGPRFVPANIARVLAAAVPDGGEPRG